MSYKEFLDNIEQYVGKIVEFTYRFKADGKIMRAERYVWDKNEFGEPAENALIEVLDVRVVRDTFPVASHTDEKAAEFLPYITRNLSQDERCELWGCLIDVVEDWLESRGITPEDIPNDEREGEGAAIIYGCDYDILADGFAAVLGISRDYDEGGKNNGN